MTIQSCWLELLVESCRIDSTTVTGAQGATQVAQLYGRELQAMGFELTWHDTDPSEASRGKHLRAVRCPDAGPGVLLIGHTDTVLTPQAVPIRVDEKNQKIYGSGVCDMKGGNMLLLHSLEAALAQSAELSQTRIEVVFNATEEKAGPSFRVLVKDAAKRSRVGLCFEPGSAATEGSPPGAHRFNIARKGSYRFTLTCKGRAAHSGAAHDYGINAIRELARKIEALEQMTDDQKKLTLNVGVIHGGLVANQVPDHAQAWFDLRAFDQAVLDEARRQVREICATPTVQSRRDGALGTLELEESPSYPAWTPNENATWLVERYQKIAQTHGLVCVPEHSGGGSDASNVADIVPVIDGIGIFGGKCHQTEEWADLASFIPRSHTVRDLMVSFCDQASH